MNLSKNWKYFQTQQCSSGLKSHINASNKPHTTCTIMDYKIHLYTASTKILFFFDVLPWRLQFLIVRHYGMQEKCEVCWFLKKNIDCPPTLMHNLYNTTDKCFTLECMTTCMYQLQKTWTSCMFHFVEITMKKDI